VRARARTGSELARERERTETLVKEHADHLAEETAAREQLEAKLARIAEKVAATRDKHEARLRDKSEKYLALEKKLAEHGAEIRALTKQFEKQLATDLAKHKLDEHEIILERDQFQQRAETQRSQLEQEAELRQDLEAQLTQRRPRRARWTAKGRARSGITGALVFGVFALTIAVGWYLTGQRLPSQKDVQGFSDDVVESKFDADVEDNRSILRAQELLVRLGYDPGPADGVAGRETRAALRAFQTDVGMERTGEVTDAVLARLRVQDQRNNTR